MARYAHYKQTTIIRIDGPVGRLLINITLVDDKKISNIQQGISKKEVGTFYETCYEMHELNF